MRKRVEHFVECLVSLARDARYEQWIVLADVLAFNRKVQHSFWSLNSNA
jgi:hypothetical protein